ncbi:hypothetical protein [Butyrivibrio sp. XPD2002]|uniref:hypothetical protein n=1 Tax=Butyrivibrio sp. XPD2002 TaxID=1280665 RepID=UPI000405B364|nr:hypothetical protein [Butyrivibrio sp. XPD2002]
MEDNKIFREKSIERVSSPEQLNDYIQVTTPSIWIILLAVIVLLTGTLIWGIFGEIHVNTEAGEKTVAPITCILN